MYVYIYFSSNLVLQDEGQRFKNFKTTLKWLPNDPKEFNVMGKEDRPIH